MKRILILLLVFCSMTALAQKPITASITMPSQPAANTADWLTGAVPIMINAQSKLVQGQLPPQVMESRILVKIKIPGGAGICGSYTSTTAPLSNFNKANMSWSGAAVMGLLGQECTLKAGTYTLCVQFFSAYAPIQPLSEEVCKSFTIAENKQVIYSGPQNLAPANGASITQLQAKQPMQLRWISVRPPPPNNDDIMYTVHVFVVEKGQSPVQAAKTNTPIFEKQVSTTQTIWQVPAEFTSSKETVTFAWNVQANGTARVNGAEPKSYGNSEPTTITFKKSDEDAKLKELSYDGPMNITPPEGKVFTKEEIAQSIRFTWSPVTPTPKEPVVYKVRVREWLPGRPRTDMDKNTRLIAETEVTNQTQTNLKLAQRCNDCTGWVWSVEAVGTERVQGGAPKSYGQSEPTSFMMSSAGCGTNKDSVKITCKGLVNGVPTYSVSITFNNIIPTSGGQQCTTVMNSITSSTGTISGIATLPVTIPVGGSSPAVTFTYTPFVSGATTASFSYQGIWNDGNSNTSNFSNTNVVLPSCGCACGNWRTIYVNDKKYDCGAKIPWKCNTPVNLDFGYNCSSKECLAKIEWNVIKDGNSIKSGTGTGGMAGSFTPTENGTYVINFSATCNGKICEGCTITIIVKDCPPCDCGKWGFVSVNNKEYDCGAKIPWNCNTPVKFDVGYQCSSDKCKALVEWNVIKDGNNNIKSGSGTGSVGDFFTPTANGTYVINFQATCNGIKCKPCTITIVVKDCPECACGKWGLVSVNNKQYDCGAKIPWKCNVPVKFNVDYHCSSDTCKAKVEWNVIKDGNSIKSGTGIGGVGDFFTPTENGTYVINFTATCNGIKCEGCTITIVVKDCPKCDCGNWGKIDVKGTNYVCGDKIPWSCDKAFSFKTNYFCDPSDTSCKAITSWEIKKGMTSIKTGSGLSGMSDVFTPNSNGTYTITLNATCGGKVCKSCIFYVIVDNCKTCDCGKWTAIEINGKEYDCNADIPWKCNLPAKFLLAYECKGDSCKAVIEWNVIKDGNSIKSGSGIGTASSFFTPTQNGTYLFNFSATCNGIKCATCTIRLIVKDCQKCTCGDWGRPVVNGVQYDCNKALPWKCNVPIKFSQSYFCNPSGDSCKAKISWEVKKDNIPIKSGSGINNVGDYFVPAANGTYTITFNASCNGIECKPCTITFVVEDCVDCCKNSSWGTISWKGIPTVKCNTSLVAIFPVGSVQTVNYTFNCFPGYPGCKARIRYDVKDQATGTVLSSVTANSGANQNITMPSASGIYCLVAYGICNEKICDSCKVCFRTTCENCNKVSITDNTVHVNGSYLSIKGSIITPGSVGVLKVTAQLVSFSADNFPPYMINPPVPNFEFAKQSPFGISKINGVPIVNLDFSLTGARSNIVISNGPLPAVIPFDLKVDNYRYKRFRHYRVKFTIFFADGSYCEKEIQKNQ